VFCVLHNLAGYLVKFPLPVLLEYSIRYSIEYSSGKHYSIAAALLKSQKHSVPHAPQVKFSPSLLVWGGMTARGLTKLHIIPQKTSVDSNYYKYISEILEKEVKPAFSRTKISSALTSL